MTRAFLSLRFFPALVLASLGPVVLGAWGEAPEGETTKVRAMGFAQGEGRAARAAALADAERSAVELVVEDIVGPEWDAALEAIYAQPFNYVRTSRPIEFQPIEDGLKVEAEVYVFERQLRRDAAALIFRELSVKPRVAFLIGEEIEEARPWGLRADSFALTFLRKRFEEAGFHVLEPASAFSRYSDEDLMDYQAGGASQVAEFGRDVQADLVIRGDAFVRFTGPKAGSNVARLVAEVEIEVTRPEDGVILERLEAAAAVNGLDPEVSGRQAIEDALARIVQDALVTSVLGYVNAPDASYYLVNVGLPGRGPWLSRARRGIRERLGGPGLQDLHHSAEQARFRIDFDGTLAEMVHLLTDEDFDGFRFETERAAGLELDLELVLAE